MTEADVPTAATDQPVADVVDAIDAGETVPCPNCKTGVLPGETFCEACGASLGVDAPTPVASQSTEDVGTHRIQPPSAAPTRRECSSCGGVVADDGYCSVCGARALSERDHWKEQPASWIGAVCDKGIQHARNEDAMANAALPEPGSFAAMVVCDGVTTAPASDVASLAASRAARDVLAAGSGTRPATTSAVIRHWTSRLGIATTAANQGAAAVAATVPPSAEPPSCTFVAVVVDGPVAVCGWVGDSRAYWLPDVGDGVQLSIDDSWATDQVAAGMARAEAEADPRCHSITRWLGIDAPDPTPRCASVALDQPGWLLVCSDGLWNYASPPSELRRLIDDAISNGIDDDPISLAAELVTYANGCGGQDNITAVLARIANATPSPSPRPDTA